MRECTQKAAFWVQGKQFAAADVIVIAAPYWDLMFPAVLKTYLENITVTGITFCYSDQGRPQSMCKAKAEIIAGSQNYTIPYPAKYGDPDRKQGVT